MIKLREVQTSCADNLLNSNWINRRWTVLCTREVFPDRFAVSCLRWTQSPDTQQTLGCRGTGEMRPAERSEEFLIRPGSQPGQKAVRQCVCVCVCLCVCVCVCIGMLLLWNSPDYIPMPRPSVPPFDGNNQNIWSCGIYSVRTFYTGTWCTRTTLLLYLSVKGGRSCRWQLLAVGDNQPSSPATVPSSKHWPLAIATQ